MNKCVLIGRLSNAPQKRLTDTGKMVCRFNLAVTRRFKDQNGDYEADFINCVAFGKTAELISEYSKKGDRIGVEGRIQTGSYIDQSGSKRYTTDVAVERVEFLTQKKQTVVQTGAQADKEEQTDIFADFGNEIDLDDNFLD